MEMIELKVVKKKVKKKEKEVQAGHYMTKLASLEE